MAELTEVRPRARAAVRRERRIGGSVARTALWPVVGMVVTILGWWLSTDVFSLVHPAVLPPPGEVLDAFTAKPTLLFEGMLETTLETLIGFLLSTVAGVLIGLALAASQTLERMFSPLLIGINAIPKVTIAPLLVFAFGWGQQPILIMVFLLCFFPIVLATTSGLTATPSDLVELARSLHASRFQAFRKVRMPAALPQIFVGLKVAMPLAAIGAVIGEFQAGAGKGLGTQIIQFGGQGDSATAWVAILLIGIMSIVLYYGLVLVEYLTLPWVRETTSAR
ncbi:ABC transporter permease [Micromonospora sp. NBC_01699]|uniref:ABC transporter permease n=1 Tax=Micromonospora sp. NBC_01699 TaxID=2975984 RepID=UPI002E2ABB6D|nr:ABC transporter permease [Micromonospora sp. NBC_01699]